MNAKLFVYGTLRRGSDMPERKLLDLTAALLGEGSAPGLLYDLGDYPGMRPGEGRVYGEVYELKDPTMVLRVLDSYEDVRVQDQGAFYREELDVTLADGGKVRCWAYLLTQTPQPAQRIASGRWEPRS